MRALRFLPLALLALLHAQGAHSQCVEPSALDLDPMVEPLRVEKAGSGDLRVSWEAVMADGYRLHRGRLDRLHANQAYNHLVVDEPTGPESIVDGHDRPWYFLVGSDCRASDSDVGRDSLDVQRPYGGLISVRVGLQGGMGVFACQFSLFFPEASAFTDTDAVTFVGPFERGAPGSPIPIANPNLPGEVRAVAAFLFPDPDPSFDPPPDTPIDVLEVLFGYHGAVPPAAGEFSVGGCIVKDVDNQDVPETSCVVSGYDVLF